MGMSHAATSRAWHGTCLQRTAATSRPAATPQPRAPLVRWEPMELQERTDMLISLTPAAAAKIRDLMAEDADVSVLRVAVEGGGCSGFQYGLGFDRGAQEGDHEFE